MSWAPILQMLHFLAAVIYIDLSIRIFTADKKAALNRTAIALLLCFAIWSICITFMSIPGLPKDIIPIIWLIYPIGRVAFPPLTLLLFLIMADQKKILKSPALKLVFFILPVFFFFLHSKRLLMQYPVLGNYGWYPIWNKNLWVYLYYIYFILFTLLGILLIDKYSLKINNKILKKMSLVISIGSITTLLSGTFIEIILPVFSKEQTFFSQFSDIIVLIWAFSINYAINSYGLFKITPTSAAEDIIANMSEALIILDEFFNIIFFNNATLQLFGCEESDLKNRPFIILFSDFGISNYWLKTNITQKVFKGFQTSLIKKDGGNIPVLLSSSVITKQNDITGLICVVSDISLQKKAEQELKESYDRLLELDRLKESFLSMVSHELRTPMTSIKGFVSFLLSGVAGQTSPKQREFLEIIQSNSDRLLMLINELLDVSKMTSGSFSIQKSDCDIVKIMGSSINDINSLIEKKKIAIVKENPFKSLNVKADEYRISQAIINLLTNAIKFSKNESKITVGLNFYSAEKFNLPVNIKRLVQNEKHLIIYIKDEGVGLTPEQNQKLFTRFYQAENVNTRSAQGTGLGLYITKNIVQLHEGFIWAESEGINKGTAFFILLPME